ncbi:MAG: contractile injection system protein, VgrG/Pvc8 family [Halobacteriales archaeon]|nr:contractile injection system protein, VgrG/Pvc8 family [Halobacteriales archaeon]
MQDFEAFQAEYNDFYVPRFEVIVNGTTITESDGLISGLTVDTSLWKANRASFTVSDIFDLETREFTQLKKENFKVGNELRVKIGYGDATKLLFYGKLESVEPQFDADSGASISVAAEDGRTQLKSSARDDSWDESSVGSVVEKIVTEHGFPDKAIGGSSGGGPTLKAPNDLQLEKFIKASENDREFLSLLANAYGYEMFFRDETFHFRRPNRNADAATIRLQYGRSLRSFTPGQPGNDRDIKKVIVKDVDNIRRKPIKGVAARQEGSREVTKTRTVESEEEAKIRAQALLNDLTRGPTTSAEVLGLPDIRIGKPIKLTGLTERFDGAYYIEETTHNITNSGYTTRFTTRKIPQQQ